MLTSPADYPIGETWIFDIGIAQIESNFQAPGVMHYHILSGTRAGQRGQAPLDIQRIRPKLFFVSWQEADHSTVVHLEDFEHGTFHSCLTAPDGSLHRFQGRMWRRG